ncbi:hypothetical protein IMZ48_49160 [Candidatus Bathyarchaeota archaeon]|nr:hypothetical protein [Candidatus Bathyarchaeota archaeon]
MALQLVALAVAGGARLAEEGAEADLAGALSEERLDDGQVRDEDGDEGFAAGPLAARDGAF